MVSYKNSITPKVQSLYPEYGTSLGGKNLTIAGEGFGDDGSKAKVLIDMVECQIQAISDREIVCITGKRQGL